MEKIDNWIRKYQDVNPEQVLEWIEEASTNDLPDSFMDEFLDEKYRIYQAPEDMKEKLENDLYDKMEKAMEEEEPEDQEEEPEEFQKPDKKSNILGFKNPDLSNLEKTREEPEYNLQQEESLEQLKKPIQETREEPEPQEFISKKMSQEEIQAKIEIYKPMLDLMKTDPNVIAKFGQQINVNNLPPFFILRPVLLNNEVKDPNNTNVLIDIVSNENPQVVRKNVPLPEAVEITKEMAEDFRLERSLNNFNSIIEAMTKREEILVSLIYLLELYNEKKERSPFEFNIPKTYIVETIHQVFGELRQIIVNQVVTSMDKTRQDFGARVSDVRQVVEESLGNVQITMRDAIERVFWKVKTDVDATNLEDIKRAQLTITNKIGNTENLGALPMAIMAIMIGDFQKRLISEDFHIDAIKEFRTYDVVELQKRLNYKTPQYIFKGLSILSKANLIRVFDNGSFSLK